MPYRSQWAPPVLSRHVKQRPESSQSSARPLHWHGRQLGNPKKPRWHLSHWRPYALATHEHWPVVWSQLLFNAPTLLQPQTGHKHRYTNRSAAALCGESRLTAHVSKKCEECNSQLSVTKHGLTWCVTEELLKSKTLYCVKQRERTCSLTCASPVQGTCSLTCASCRTKSKCSRSTTITLAADYIWLARTLSTNRRTDAAVGTSRTAATVWQEKQSHKYSLYLRHK